jgi:hypothetical protein|nr:MAG TPA: Tape measure domain protein [Caudoviricetes sp.]
MAGGNLGDLWFQLGVKDNTSKELQKIIDKLKTGDDAANSLLRALQGFGTKKSGFKEQAEKAKEFADVLNEINRRISKLKKNDKSDEAKDLQMAVKNALSYLDMLQRINIERSKISELRSLNPNVDTSKLKEAELMLENVNNQLYRLQNKAQGGGGGGVDYANVLQDYAKVLQMTFRDVKQITDQFKKENPLSAFSGGAAKVEADISRVTEKLAKMRDLMADGALKGYNTNMLGGSITELDKILSRLQSASGNKSILTDAAQMKNLLSDVAVEMTKATAATQAYGREKGKAIAVEREFAAAAKLSAKDNEAELKAQSDYIKRYMALVEKKREIAEKAGISPFFKNDQGLKNIKAEIDTMLARLGKVREDITLYQHAIGTGTKEGISFGSQGLKEANAEAEKLMGTITALQNVYDTLRASQANVKDLVGQTPQKQRQDDVQKKMSEYYSNLEKSSARQAAQAARDAAKAKREDISVEKQRQNELKNTERRYDSLGNKVRQLRSEYSRGISIGADVSKAETEIKRLLSLMRAIRSIRDRLNSENWRDYVGALGGIGSGHDTTLASRVLQDQRAVNREVQRGVELEQKRQQEIAQSAAKARNDLAAAFAGANAEAKKMQSIVGDIKSLFLQGGIVFGAQQFFNSIVQTGGEIVQQHVALRSILGDVQKADELFAQTQQLALQSPFKFGELNRDVKQLAAFGVEANDLYDTTKRLADIASGLGVDFGRLGLAFGQVKARSWLDGKELRQFAYAGLPLLQKITELYNSEGKNGRKNYTQADVKKMISGRQVSFEDVQKVLWKMTDEGGQFYNMQLVLSETLLGRWNKLIDAWDIMLGKFAEGKNVIGGTFSFIINRVTDLVLALDKLSPAMLSFGAIFAARKLGMMASGKLGLGSINKNYTQQMNAQLRTYAIEQQQLVTEGKITQQKALQNVQARAYLLSDTTSRANAMSRLALEGKMSVLQMQKAVKEGLVTKELIRQLAVMGQITARQEQIILGGTRFAAVMNMGISKIGGGIKSLFTMLGGWWGLAIGAAVQIFSSYSSDMDRISENAKGFRDSAYTKKKGYEDELADEKPTNSADLQQRVNSMKELLRNSGDYTQTIEDQIARAKNLNEQYDILNKGIIAARDNSQQEANDSDVVAGALGASGGWGSGNPFADTIEESVEDLNEAVVKYQTLLSGLDEETKSRMDSVANQFLKPEERAMSLDEKIRILAERGGANWDSFVLKSSNGSNDIANSIYKIGIRANKVSDQINDIAKKNVPRIINFLKKAFNLFGADFSKWCNKNSSRFERMIDNMLDACKVNVPQIREYLKSIFYQEAGAKQPKKAGGKKVKPKTPMQQRVRRNLSKKGKSKGKVESQAAMLDSYLDETSDYNTDNNLQTELQNRYNEYKNRENKFKRGKISKALRDEAWNSYNSLNEAAWEGLGYKFYPQDKKSNKVPKGRTRNTGNQEDKELETLRKRVELYKKFYSELEKYRKMYGEEGAMAQIRHDKEFKNSVLSWGLSDPGTYGVSIEELMKRVRSSTQKRKEYKESQLADIHAKNRSIEEERIKSTNSQLSKQLNILSSQYETYKKIYELTGNSEGSSLLAFGHVQSGTYQDYLKEQMKWAIGDHNQRTGQNLSADDVLKMSESDFKKHVGDESENASVIYKEWTEETNRIKKETIDLMANLIEKNATIAQQIDDENRKYERQLELIKGIEDPQMRDRAKAGATKTHNENVAKLQFEQFKQESDWVTIFDDLDRVSSATISSMITKIDDFSRTTGLSVEVVKQLRDALDKLRKEDIDRNPLPYIFGAVNQGNAIGGYLKGNLGAQYMNGKKYVPTAEQAKKMGIEWSAAGYSKNELASKQKGKYADSSNAINVLAGKFKALESALDPVVNLFKVMGEEDSIFGQITGGASNALGAASQVSGGLNALGLGNLGPYGAAVGAGLSVASSLIGAFGADYSEYNKAKQKYETLSSIWDSLISKKSEYMNIHWGTEAANASKEAQEMLEAEIKQTKVIAMKNFNSGASAGSHSIKVRDWEKRGWKQAAPEISKRYGVKFDNMTDILDIDYKVLQQIKKDYAELWANLDQDTRTYLDKLIEYGEKSEDMIESLTEKLTGNKYSDLVSAWGDAMATMSNTSDNLVDHFEENLRNVILKSMIENLYGEKIKALIEKTKKFGDPNGGTEKKLDTATGKVLSEYTNTEMDEIGKDLADVTKQIEASRDYLKRYYGWSDNSSSSLTNSVKGITEDTGDLIASYLNSIRLDVSVIREEQVKCMSESNEIAKSQLTQLNFISANTLRNAEAAERIERVFEEYSSNFNMVINGVKSIKVR